MFTFIKRAKSTIDRSAQNEVSNRKRYSLRSESAAADASDLAVDDDVDDLSCDTASLHSVAYSDEIFSYHSRLAMSLESITQEPNCLSHFLQFLETREALPLIKFYFDTTNFRRSALQKRPPEPSEPPKAEFSTRHTPELHKMCDVSMRKPLTDDEKYEIYAETNKRWLGGSCQSIESSSSVGAESVHVSAASIRDALAIYERYLDAEAPLHVDLPVSMMASITLVLCQRDDDACADSTDGCRISAQCFESARHFVLERLERNYVSDFLQSAHYCRFCLELIESSKIGGSYALNIGDILYNESTLFFFMEYLELQNDQICLEFWTAAINFRRSYLQPTEDGGLLDEARLDAMIIYNKYFSLQSDKRNRLWLADKLRSHVEEYICYPDKLAYAFDLSLQTTAKYLERKYLADFLSSPLFENYVSELRAKIAAQNVNGAPTEFGGLTSDKHQNECRAVDETDNKITSTPQTERDAQLLWQRPECGKLTFGRVNSLGRYERDFDMVDGAAQSPGHWSLSSSGTKLKNAMRKLVNLPEDKVQEEIAWQMAEMIIKDVTSVTLNHENRPST